MIRISSLSNPTIKDLVRLKKAHFRKERGLIIVDGAREIELAIQSGVEILSLFYCPALVREAAGTAKKLFGIDNNKVVEVSEEVFKKICYKENPDGFLVMAQLQELKLGDIDAGKNPLIIILEKVEKPGNLGAILRTAYAAGATAVIINDSQTDIYNPNVIRASEGYVFKETIVNAGIKETIKWLKQNKIKSFGAATSGSKNYTAVDLSEPSAVILGSEADGLSPDWLKSADQLIKIPMQKGIDSLNVSVSAAVIVFEALRQRAKK